ncbi:MAG: ribosome biogenesis GTPase Der [Deltaproteobacteria bacterium]|nr:ribosome biogenesis GTPase Der [Deltaproteobacteria bacterium]
MKPVIAIIGRPNVGKSTLFNRLIGRRQAVVHNAPGVTRDRLFGTCEWNGARWQVVDTGGMAMGEDTLSRQVMQQSRQAMADADVILSLFDGRSGLTPLDATVVEAARGTGRPVLFAVNKCETDCQPPEEFYRLGVDPLFGISAEHGLGIDTLLDGIAEVLATHHPIPSDEATAGEEGLLRVALIGRPNVGKSTLVNTLAGETRVVAHDLPGTTRDVIDVDITRRGERALLLDTAGIRRRARIPEAIEKFSVIKALRAMERADVVVILTDATEGMTHQDRALAAEAVAHGRPTILALNKWDRVQQQPEAPSAREYIEGVAQIMGALRRIPTLLLSAKEGTGVDPLWQTVQSLGGASQRRLPTSVLNTVIERVQQQHHIPVHRGHNVKLYYATQTGVHPPRVACFTNFPDAIPQSYRRYLLRALEEAFESPGLPIRLTFRKKS